MEQKETNIVIDFAYSIFDLLMKMGHTRIVDCEVLIDEMRGNGLMIQEQRETGLYYVPIDYLKEIPKYLNEELLVLANSFDDLLIYCPGEAKKLFRIELMKRFKNPS